MTIVESFKAFLKRLRTGATVDPVRDWIVLLSIAAIALIVIIVWNAWTFSTVAGGGTIGAPVAKAPSIFSSSSLDAIHTVFERRAVEEAKHRTGTYRYADPSQ